VHVRITAATDHRAAARNANRMQQRSWKPCELVRCSSRRIDPAATGSARGPNARDKQRTLNQWMCGSRQHPITTLPREA